MMLHRLAAVTLLVQAIATVAQPAGVQLPTSIVPSDDGKWVLKEGVTDDGVEELRKVFLQFMDLMYQNQLMPSHSEPWGSHRGGTIGREAITAFLEKTTRLLSNNSRCLEWGRHYISTIPACTENWNFKYGNKKSHGTADLAEKSFLADLDHPGQRLLEEFGGYFDAIFPIQVFEHVSHPWLSAKHIYHLLKPGGLLFFTAPFLSRYHNSPEDHFRYTVNGAIRIFQDAGFVVRRSYVGGSSFLTASYLLGYGTADLSPAQLDDLLIEQKAWRANRRKPTGNGRHRDDDLMFGNFILFQKPA